MAIPTERRKYQRVVLTRPLPGRLGAARIYVIDASLIGLRIAHQGSAPPQGSACRVEFEWEGRLIALDCEVRRNALHKLAKDKNEKSIYHAGLSIVGAIGDSDTSLRQMIAAIVARALDEQKANARGVPAEAAQCFQTGKGTEYVRCELVGGSWRRTETSRADQPLNGFTVSAEESREHVDMLCDTFTNADDEGTEYVRCELVGGSWRRTETSRADQPLNGFTVSAEESREHVDMLCDTFTNADDEGRRLIKMMAELSISRAEGVPTRRYVP